MFTDYSLQKSPRISAFATIGMSAGITSNLPPAAVVTKARL